LAFLHGLSINRQPNPLQALLWRDAESTGLSALAGSLGGTAQNRPPQFLARPPGRQRKPKD